MTISSSLPAAWVGPLDEFTAHLRASGRRPGTVRLRLHFLGRLAAVHPGPWAVSADDLARWLGGPSWAPETRKSARAAVRTFYGWAARTGRVKTSPAEFLDPVTVPRALPRPASDDALAGALGGGSDRDRLMLLLAAYAGLRCMEIARVHPADVDWSASMLRVRGKGGRVRDVPLHPVLAAELLEELGRRRAGGHGSGWRYGGEIGPDGWLFPGQSGEPMTAGHVVRVLSRRLGPGWSAHTLRHRFASKAYAVARDLRAVQELLGHSKPETTAWYTAVPNDALRAAVDGIGGPS